MLLCIAWGVAVGLAATPMQLIAQRQTGRGALGIVIAVNFLLPLGAFLVAIWYPRVRAAIPGGLLVGAGFIVERIAEVNPAVWNWSPKFVALHTHPISVAASVGCAIVGAIAATLVKPFRRVGLADQHLRCPVCGYLMTGLPSAGCPECGNAMTVVAG